MARPSGSCVLVVVVKGFVTITTQGKDFDFLQQTQIFLLRRLQTLIVKLPSRTPWDLCRRVSETVVNSAECGRNRTSTLTEDEPPHSSLLFWSRMGRI